MLKAALCGGYVNFGVFSLYGDDALEKALKTFVELLSSIPHSNLLVRKLLISVLGLWIDHRSIWYRVYYLHGKTKKSNGSRHSVGEASFFFFFYSAQLIWIYRIYLINRPGRLLNFWTFRVGAY